MIKTMQPN